MLVSGNPAAAAGSEVDVHVAVRTGPEAVTGSTRMKAGTAQKLVLNALSTAAMVRSGRTWSNLMVGAAATNGKLRGRVAAALAEATGEDPETCAAAVRDAGGDGRVALLTLLSGVPAAAARRRAGCDRRSPEGRARVLTGRRRLGRSGDLRRRFASHAGQSQLDSVRTGRSLPTAYRPSVAQPREAPGSHRLIAAPEVPEVASRGPTLPWGESAPPVRTPPDRPP